MSGIPPAPVHPQPPPGGFAAPAPAPAPVPDTDDTGTKCKTYLGGYEKYQLVAMADSALTWGLAVGFFYGINGPVWRVFLTLGAFNMGICFPVCRCVLRRPRQVWPLVFWIVVTLIRFAGLIILLISIGSLHARSPTPTIADQRVPLLNIWIAVFVIWTIIYVDFMVIIFMKCIFVQKNVGAIQPGNAMGMEIAPPHHQYQTAAPPSAV